MNAVVLGGTFAPPTLAHLSMMRAALEFTRADKGIWTPASLGYVRAWRSNDTPDEMYLDASKRTQMLELMLAGDARMEICAREIISSAPAYTYDTLKSLKARFETLWFVIGSDNLRSLPEWHEAEALVSEFLFLVCERKKDDTREIIAKTPLLKAHAARITPLALSNDMRGVSAGRARALIREGRLDEARALLHPAVFDYIAAQPPSGAD